MKLKGKLIHNWILCIIIMAVVLIFCLMIIIPLTENSPVGYDIDVSKEESSNWMSMLSDDLLLADINIPGTHDSAAYYPRFEFIARCQSSNIFEQLEAGFRYMDIRLTVNFRDGEPALRLAHGISPCKKDRTLFSDYLYLEDVIEDCKAFLSEHQRECILFSVKLDYGNESDEKFQRILEKYIAAEPELWYLDGKLPSLGEARGKLVLLQRNFDKGKIENRLGVDFYWDNQNEDSIGRVEHPWNTVTKNDFSLNIEDRFCFSKTDKWNSFKEALENAPGKEISGDVNLSFLSTRGRLVYGHPYRFAKALNTKLMDYEFNSGEKYGWIIVDFGTAAVAEKIYKTNKE